MNAVKNWDDVKPYTGAGEKLPAGGYIGKIIGAKVVTYSGKNGSFEKLEIAVDVTEGDYADYFKDQYESSTVEGKKWKGVCRYYVPTQDGSDRDAVTQRILKGATQAIEGSNPGYKWDWDETKLKGKKVGFLVRDKEYDFNGHQGFSPEVFMLMSTSDISEGRFKDPKPKLLEKGTASAPPAGNSFAGAVAGADEEYPF